MFEFVYDYASKETITKYIRLAVVVGFYVLFRQYYANYAKAKQLKHQLAQDEKEAKDKPEADKKKEELQKQLEEDNVFGWGKKTRNRKKQQQAIIDQLAEETRLRYQTAYDAAEDHDIEDLLE
ncbi:uncharacterized protein CANTADRAFT_43774 [Suhomyces tanzawaensis NRRL Y-17324]|uniref:Processing of GAS1 and ALP protein 2 n=1 Tax=Suhomyces tanzawaensis NRRL Y-17324 TaxID=984487 RepID=A0A1E4SRM9_9ASCO|nr:uncharacterized protein CANTADRAFT_43774 [Suhomyces tanzawaensis NRRL Y-17324]ODV82158.1 hypothetical protein CANTADRAFT_43774 [Suhomyces tanzawaensis NRRL Y-17324]